MPIKKSAMKAMRQNIKAAVKNSNTKKRVKDLVKSAQKLVAAKKQNEAVVKVKDAIKAIDKAIQKKILKKNTGARHKSRLVKKLNQLMK